MKRQWMKGAVDCRSISSAPSAAAQNPTQHPANNLSADFAANRAGGGFHKLLPVGTRLRILPNHACATAAQFPEYQAYSEAGEMNAWPRFYGW
jgi:D-serine deaminase-like pyridoxal phosphate-dependent protein